MRVEVKSKPDLENDCQQFILSNQDGRLSALKSLTNKYIHVWSIKENQLTLYSRLYEHIFHTPIEIDIMKKMKTFLYELAGPSWEIWNKPARTYTRGASWLLEQYHRKLDAIENCVSDFLHSITVCTAHFLIIALISV